MDSLAKFSSSPYRRSPSLILWPDLCLLFRTHINKMRSDQWKNQLPNFGTWYRSIYLTIPPHLSWFYNLKFPRKIISSFSRLRFGYKLLPSHSYNLFLNIPSLCALHISEAILIFLIFSFIELLYPNIKSYLLL